MVSQKISLAFQSIVVIHVRNIISSTIIHEETAESRVTTNKHVNFNINIGTIVLIIAFCVMGFIHYQLFMEISKKENFFTNKLHM